THLGGRVFLRAARGCFCTTCWSSGAAGRRGYRVAYPNRRVDPGDGTRSGGRSLFLHASGAALVCLGVGGRCDFRVVVAMERRWGGGGVLWRDHLPDRSAGFFEDLKELRVVAGAGYDDGGGERFQHSLLSEAARFFVAGVCAGFVGVGA